MKEPGDGADVVRFACSRCHQVIAAENGVGPRGWQLQHGMWVCGGCSHLGPPQEPARRRRFRDLLGGRFTGRKS